MNAHLFPGAQRFPRVIFKSTLKPYENERDDDDKMTDSDVARKFVGMINEHDLDGLVALMTDDHVFVDSLGIRFSRPAIEIGWKEYFDVVPDYWVRIDRMLPDEDVWILIGAAGGTYVPKGGVMNPDNKWETPAVWLAKIRGEKVAEWRIYSDNEPIRAKIGNPDSWNR